MCLSEWAGNPDSCHFFCHSLILVCLFFVARRRLVRCLFVNSAVLRNDYIQRHNVRYKAVHFMRHRMPENCNCLIGICFLSQRAAYLNFDWLLLSSRTLLLWLWLPMLAMILDRIAVTLVESFFQNFLLTWVSHRSKCQGTSASLALCTFMAINIVCVSPSSVYFCPTSCNLNIVSQSLIFVSSSLLRTL